MTYLKNDTFNTIDNNSLLLILDLQNKYKKYYNKKIIKNIKNLINLFMINDKCIAFTRFYKNKKSIKLLNEKINNNSLLKKIENEENKKISLEFQKLDDNLAGSIITKNIDKKYGTVITHGKCPMEDKFRCNEIIEDFDYLKKKKNVYFIDYKIWNPFSNKKFLNLIKKERINRIYICGGFYTFCVLSTAINSLNFNILPIVIEDAIYGVDKFRDKSLAILRMLSLMHTTRSITESNTSPYLKKKTLKYKKKRNKISYKKKFIK